MPAAGYSEPDGLTGPVLAAAESENAADDGLAPAKADSAPADQAERRVGWRRTLPVVFGVVTVVLGAFGAWAAVTAHNLRSTAAGANSALVDAAATRILTRDVTSAVNKIFSYSYADTGRTRAAAQSVLTGAAIRQYNELFRLVEQEAPKEKLVVTTRVTNIGVELLTQGRARLLVFANQQDTINGTGKSSYGGAMFAVTAVRRGGTWKIENIDTFTGTP